MFSDRANWKSKFWFGSPCSLDCSNRDQESLCANRILSLYKSNFRFVQTDKLFVQIESSLDCSNRDQESLCANRIFSLNKSNFLFVQKDKLFVQIESSLDCSNRDQESLCANRIFRFLFVQIEFSAYTKVIFSLCKKNFWMLCSRYLFVQIEFSKSGVFVHFVHFVLLCANRIYPKLNIFFPKKCSEIIW